MRFLFACVLLVIASTAAAMYDAKSPVVSLTPESFDSSVIQSDELWVVEFYAPWCGHCKRLTPEWDKAAKQLEGTKIHIAAVDADQHRELGNRFNVQGFPTIKVFGADKLAPTDYEGPRQAAGIVRFAKTEWKKIEAKRNGEPVEEEPEEAPTSEFYDGTDVVELSDAMFDKEVAGGKEPWLIEFYAPWCGHCKNLVPEWKKAASSLGGVVRLGAVDATTQKKWAQKFNVNGFPTIKFIPPGNPDAAEDYQGGRSSENIVTYALNKAEKYPAAPVVVSQIENQAAFEKLRSSNPLSVVFVVPHVIDTGAAGRQKLLDMFGEIAGQLRTRRIAFGWIVGGEHESFESVFNIRDSYPTYVVYNADKGRAATHKGTFVKANILNGIKAVLSGKSPVSQVKEAPKLSNGVPLWDGKDYVPPADDE